MAAQKQCVNQAILTRHCDFSFTTLINYPMIKIIREKAILTN